MDILDHETTFERAWNDPANTRYEMRPVDINRVLDEYYDLSEPLLFTRSMLWDMEVRKARRPDLFIPFVVAEGSADAWGDGDTFTRKSSQRLWLAPERYGLIIERTHLDHTAQKVTFIGVAQHPDRDGEPLHATTEQPIFHVVHSVGGEETRPLNEWLIVYLTDGPDERIVEVLENRDRDPWLPMFVEIYIRDVLGLGLTRREGS